MNEGRLPVQGHTQYNADFSTRDQAAVSCRMSSETSEGPKCLLISNVVLAGWRLLKKKQQSLSPAEIPRALVGTSSSAGNVQLFPFAHSRHCWRRRRAGGRETPGRTW
jgi:hypothetical protein